MKWEMIERGWWICNGVGGVCLEEKSTWFAYPNWNNCPNVKGFKTLKLAKKWIENEYKKHNKKKSK